MSLRTKILLRGSAALVLIILATRLSAETPEAGDSTSFSLAELQQQRLEVLEHLARVTKKGYLQGDIAYDEYVTAQQRVLAAKLELTDDHASRLALFRQSVQLAETLAKRTEEQFALGKVTQREVLIQRAEALQARIRLKQESEASGSSTQGDSSDP